MKPSREQVFAVVKSLSTVIPFFPTDPLALDLITEAVLEFVGTEEQLHWFASATVRNLPKYEGMPSLRRLFSTKYAPADGIDPVFESSEQFIAHEALMESNFHKREMEENERRFESYKHQAQMAPAEDREPFQLPESLIQRKMLPPAPVEPPKRSLAEREAELAALPKSPARTLEENDRIARELEEQLRRMPTDGHKQ